MTPADHQSTAFWTLTERSEVSLDTDWQQQTFFRKSFKCFSLYIYLCPSTTNSLGYREQTYTQETITGSPVPMKLCESPFYCVSVSKSAEYSACPWAVQSHHTPKTPLAAQILSPTERKKRTAEDGIMISTSKFYQMSCPHTKVKRNLLSKMQESRKLYLAPNRSPGDCTN